MTEKALRLRWTLVWALIALAVIAVLAATLVVNRYRYAGQVATSLFTQDQSIIETTTKMSELRDKNQFDEAIALGLNSIKGVPSDHYTLHAIATVFFVRSSRQTRERKMDEARRGVLR